MHGYIFNVKKSIQSLGYLQFNTNITDKLALVKLLFFADRFHLRTYGIPMLSDNYKALRKGPVCSKTLDLINKKNYFDSLDDSNKKYVVSNVESENCVVIVAERQKDSLSKSAIKALDFSIENFSKFDPADLADLSHSYPEWGKFSDFLKKNPQKSKDMDYLDFFDDPIQGDEGIENYLDGKDPFACEKSLLLATKTEYAKIVC